MLLAVAVAAAITDDVIWPWSMVDGRRGDLAISSDPMLDDSYSSSMTPIL
jgi:hypothetical protein